jgi:hypothetical protein
MSGFFGLVTSSLKTTISTTSISTGRSSTTSSISVTATNSGGGTLTYSWRITGANATINTSSTSSTTVTGLGVTGTTELYCNITNSVTGVTYPSPTCIITWAATAPNAPTIGVSSSGDKSFTINWTAPIDDGGDTITGYYVQNSTNGGTSWSTPILVSAASTSYNWSGDTVVYNGNTYIGRVAAVNSIGTGSYSGDSVGRVPTFSAPTIQSINFAAPAINNPFVRPFTITFTPTSCVDYTITRIYVQNTTLESPFILGYYDDVNSGYDNLFTQTTGQQTTITISNVFAQTFASGIGWFTNSPSATFAAYVTTFNNDGYSVSSSALTGQVSPAQQSYYTYSPDGTVTTANAVILYGAGQVTVNSPTYNSGSLTTGIQDTNNAVVFLKVAARTSTLSSSYGICASSRYFLVDYTYATPSTFTQAFNGNGTPFNATGSGIDPNRVAFPSVSLGYDSASGNGKIRVRGGGTSFTTATRILVTVTAVGQIRTINYY